MSERGSFRGGRGRGGGGGGHGEHRGGGRGGGHRGGRGGGGGGHGGAHDNSAERPKKENILDLAKYMDKGISVKFNGGREITGTLKGYDQLMNLVLDDVKEVIADLEATDEAPAQPQTRDLGLIVARGTLLVSISPLEGKSEIDNPF